MKEFTTLAIDTSFDETSVSVVRGTTILSNMIPSQSKLHAKFGGVVPSIARLAHEERIDSVVFEALRRAKISQNQLDAVAVTKGPGLAIALEVGIKKAKEIAIEIQKPLVTINHMEGHLFSALANPNSNIKRNTEDFLKVKNFPALGFLISGGHTELILIKNFGEYEKIGETQDDSCGEAFDKCGRMLGLGFPAGPIVSDFARQNRKNMRIKFLSSNNSKIVQAINKNSRQSYQLTVPMANSGNLDMSYSGLKTSFKQLVDSQKKLDKQTIMDLCVIFEATAIRQLEIKLSKAIKIFQPTEIYLGGGVVSSPRLRSRLRTVAKEYGRKILYPYSNKLTTDNAAMIGVAANIRLTMNFSKNSEILHEPREGVFLNNFDAIDRVPSWSL